MAKSLLRLEARQLRREGVSLREIAQKISISKSTVSVWIRDIVLTREQIEKLRQSELRGAEIGRQKSAEIRRKIRKNTLNQHYISGAQMLPTITRRDLLMIGLALYWGEGSKKNGQLQFCNSDPKVIQFLLLWLQKCFDIPKEHFTCWVGINEIHIKREDIVKRYWSEITKIPLNQFRNTSYKRVENKKIYENFEEHYGTLFIRVVKPFIIYHQILGMIEALGKQANVAQW